jgi:hypothetical protein
MANAEIQIVSNEAANRPQLSFLSTAGEELNRREKPHTC